MFANWHGKVFGGFFPCNIRFNSAMLRNRCPSGVLKNFRV